MKIRDFQVSHRGASVKKFQEHLSFAGDNGYVGKNAFNRGKQSARV